jgi:superfamily I DNA and RNA helicase
MRAHAVQQHLVVDREVVDRIGKVARKAGNLLLERIEQCAEIGYGFVDGELASRQRLQHRREANRDHAFTGRSGRSERIDREIGEIGEIQEIEEIGEIGEIQEIEEIGEIGEIREIEEIR